MPNPISRDAVELAFLALLGRRPESDAIYDYFQAQSSVEDVIDQIKASQEYEARRGNDLLWHYNSQIDALNIIRRNKVPTPSPVPDRLVNFLGVIIDPAYLPNVLAGLGGQVQGLPFPGNWHADIAEFAAALRAVELAKNTFRVLELGCGWGCWLLNTGVAARNRGLTVNLIGAEADEGHVAFAERACLENGFGRGQFQIHRAIVGPHRGTALFPRQDQAGVSWGLEPVFDATAEQIAQNSDRFDALPIMPLAELVGDDNVIDLVHIDIQGGEADFIEGCMLDLKKQAAYLLVGTHSRAIEGRITAAMLSQGWILEIERPMIMSFDEKGVPRAGIDGVQGWRNPNLR